MQLIRVIKRGGKRWRAGGSKAEEKHEVETKVAANQKLSFFFKSGTSMKLPHSMIEEKQKQQSTNTSSENNESRTPCYITLSTF